MEVFIKSLQVDHPGLVEEWDKQVCDWEKDQTKPCPYDLPTEGEYSINKTTLRKLMSLDLRLADIKKQLTEEEHKRVEAGAIPPIAISPGTFVIEGLAIKEAQYVTTHDSNEC